MTYADAAFILCSGIATALVFAALGGYININIHIDKRNRK